ncbi:hypothetical protein F383_31670 [Gossypium arboreum]|uniref:Uncharacterized protein n=1 Tax=Gossypium arboreum TaxID=29729 RepID=A0A0B0PBI5_GOSAR|nr:hypothetical protein F383_31670 [Gossypium arboreum]
MLRNSSIQFLNLHLCRIHEDLIKFLILLLVLLHVLSPQMVRQHFHE